MLSQYRLGCFNQPGLWPSSYTSTRTCSASEECASALNIPVVPLTTLDFPVQQSQAAQNSSNETKPGDVIPEHTGSALSSNENLVCGTKLALIQVKPLKLVFAPVCLKSFRKKNTTFSINLHCSKLIYINITIEFNSLYQDILNNHMIFFVNIQRSEKSVLSIDIWIKCMYLILSYWHFAGIDWNGSLI